MSNADLAELLRFWLGLAGLLLSLNCLCESADEVRWVAREYPNDRERRRTALGWLRDALGRCLTCAVLTSSGWFLILSPTSSLAATWQGVEINWGWVVVAVYQLGQGVLAHVDRYKLRRLRKE